VGSWAPGESRPLRIACSKVSASDVATSPRFESQSEYHSFIEILRLFLLWYIVMWSASSAVYGAFIEFITQCN